MAERDTVVVDVGAADATQGIGEELRQVWGTEEGCVRKEIREEWGGEVRWQVSDRRRD